MAKVQIRASTRRTKTGKIVQIRAHDQNRDTVGEQLKTEGRTPTASQPGNFPNGRSTPSTPAVAKYEAARQDAEIRAARLRAEAAQRQLEELQKNAFDAQDTRTPAEKVSMLALVDQFDVMFDAAERGVELPTDDESFERLAPTIFQNAVQESPDQNKEGSK